MRGYRGKKFLTDEELKIKVLGIWPTVEIQNPALKDYFKTNFGRDFFGGDELVAYAQSLVSGGMSFDQFERDILADSANPEQTLREIIFKKTATGIGRGHSLGGLAGIVLGLNGTKMIDSGLTGFVASRSLATSSRRRETTTEEIVIPDVLFAKEDLLDEYLEISRDVFKAAADFKEKFGSLKGVETFNKIIPYNNPADLFIVLPLDTLATLEFETRQESESEGERYIPRELHYLASQLRELTKQAGMNVMFKQRTQVPRDTYFHYTVFKNPDLPNLALELSERYGMSTAPRVIADVESPLSQGFAQRLSELQSRFERTRIITNPKELATQSMGNMLALRSFVNEYNDAVKVRVIDSVSWRVWSEQKRHATLRQSVESVYSAVERVYKDINKHWDSIKACYENGSADNLPVGELRKNIIIDERLEKQPQLLLPYIYHTARQMMFYGKLIQKGFERRDALYIVPKNIRLRTTESYDLANLIDLELPLRLCSTCEPERQATSWKKRDAIARVFPEIDFFLSPKCNIGYCTEGKPCGHITDKREYSLELHKQVKQEMLDRAK